MGNSSNSNVDNEQVGYRVLGVQANSPAAKGGLVSFFDFIVQANGIPLQYLDSTFIDLIKASEDNPLPLQIYNWKNHSFREIILIPSKKWPGEGMLGVTIKFDSYREAEEQMLHVLEVEADSPADLAGLQPIKDYILGTAEKAFLDADSLYQELFNNLDRPIEFYVYNTDTDEVRIVIIMPTEDWGGEGILGANVAFGFLHILPSQCCETIGKSSESSDSNKVAMSSPFGSNVVVLSSTTMFDTNHTSADNQNEEVHLLNTTSTVSNSGHIVQSYLVGATNTTTITEINNEKSIDVQQYDSKTLSIVNPVLVHTPAILETRI